MEGLCRCCGSSLKENPVLTYHNMPDRAQNFPSLDELDADQGIDIELYQCPFCGLVQLLNQPVGYYRDVIRAVAVSEDMKEFRNQYFREFVDYFGLQKKRIIEIGAGCGEFMEMMLRTGADVYGLEHKRESVLTGNQKGLNLKEGFIENSNTDIEEAPFDAFYIMNFLEHIPEPNQFLQGIYRNLTGDGVGLVEVPNMDFFMEQQLFSEFMLDHLSYFTTETLRILLEKNGFEVVRCQPVWKDYVISAFVKKRKKLSFERFHIKQKKLVSEIQDFIWEEKRLGNKVAVWGAGHEALAMLSLASLSGEIEFVADSAPFKQGNYTPATHIPVVAPEQIRKQKIGAVLVMAGSYTSEVVQLMHEQYPQVKIAAVGHDGVRRTG